MGQTGNEREVEKISKVRGRERERDRKSEQENNRGTGSKMEETGRETCKGDQKKNRVKKRERDN